MKTPVFSALRRGLIGAAVVSCLAACQVLPPAHSAVSRSGIVRAKHPEKAREVATFLDRLAPAVLTTLPDSRTRKLEVWVQDTPALYVFTSSAYHDADGFWADAPKRIHLRESADNLERTLAHELVHASLGSSWRTLPGTLEEGVCDYVSGRLCPQGRARMRAGRLSSAGFATGGLVLELSVRIPAQAQEEAQGVSLGYTARMRLEGDPPQGVDPLQVFAVQAGLSSTAMNADRKKAFYGLAYLVTERIVERRGLEGLHDLCLRAIAEGRSRIPPEWLMSAADLDADPRTWRRAIAEALGEDEVRELVRMHPGFLVDTLDGFLSSFRDDRDGQGGLAGLEAHLALCGGGAEVDLLSVPEVRAGLEEAWSRGESERLAGR